MEKNGGARTYLMGINKVRGIPVYQEEEYVWLKKQMQIFVNLSSVVRRICKEEWEKRPGQRKGGKKFLSKEKKNKKYRTFLLQIG